MAFLPIRARARFAGRAGECEPSGGHCSVARNADSRTPGEPDANNEEFSETARASAFLRWAASEYRSFWQHGCLRIRAGFVTPIRNITERD